MFQIKCLALAGLIGLAGCQRSYVADNDPRYPQPYHQVAPGKWTNSPSGNHARLDKLQEFSTESPPAAE